MNLRDEWRVNSQLTSDIFYTKEETVQSAIDNFDIRRNYSAEGVLVTIDEVDVNVIIQTHSNPLNENKIDRKLFVPMGTEIYTGSYVNYENDIWLVISKINNVDNAYKICQIQECNYIIKFQSPDGTILSYPCIDETTNSVGIDENNTISTLNGIHRIKLPFDDNTKLIREDRRFFIDKSGTTTAKVTDVNNTEFNYGNKGIIELTLQKDSSYNPITDINGVCNYFEPIAPPEEPEEGVTYSVVTASGQLAIDRTRNLTAIAYNSDGSVNSGVSLIWVITKPTGYENYITCTVVGNTCTVEIKENYDLVDLIIRFEVSDGIDGYIGSKEFMIGV